MHATAIVAALAGFAAGQATHFNIVKPKPQFGALSLNNLALRQSQCTIGTPCGPGCAPVGGECCDKQRGYFCKTGNRCYNDGCCPIGVSCSGVASGCDGQEVQCGNICLPEGTECCSQSLAAYCEAGTTCSPDGTCTRGSGGSGGGGGSSSGGDQTTIIFGAGPTNTRGVASLTKSYVLSRVNPTTTSGSGSGSSGSESDSPSSDKSGSATSSAAKSAETTSDKKAPSPDKNSGAINGPNIFAGLLVAAPMLL